MVETAESRDPARALRALLPWALGGGLLSCVVIASCVSLQPEPELPQATSMVESDFVVVPVPGGEPVRFERVSPYSGSYVVLSSREADTLVDARFELLGLERAAMVQRRRGNEALSELPGSPLTSHVDVIAADGEVLAALRSLVTRSSVGPICATMRGERLRAHAEGLDPTQETYPDRRSVVLLLGLSSVGCEGFLPDAVEPAVPANADPAAG